MKATEIFVLVFLVSSCQGRSIHHRHHHNTRILDILGSGTVSVNGGPTATGTGTGNVGVNANANTLINLYKSGSISLQQLQLTMVGTNQFGKPINALGQIIHVSDDGIGQVVNGIGEVVQGFVQTTTDLIRALMNSGGITTETMEKIIDPFGILAKWVKIFGDLVGPMKTAVSMGNTFVGEENGGQGLLTGLLAPNGLLDGLLGPNGIVNGLFGQNGLVGGLLGSNGGPIGGLVSGLLGSGGLVGGILNTVNGILGGGGNGGTSGANEGMGGPNNIAGSFWGNAGSGVGGPGNTAGSMPGVIGGGSFMLG